MCTGGTCKWDLLLPPLLFAMREAPQSSLGFASFQLVYRHQPWGLSDIVQEEWEKEEPAGPQPTKYVWELRHGLQVAGEVMWEHLQQVQEKQKTHYDKWAQVREL